MGPSGQPVTEIIALLNGWACNGAERTEHAAVTGVWLQDRTARFAFVIVLARISRHGFGFPVPALRAG
jgi:hypothetical protein